MKCILLSNGFKVEGTISVQSKAKLFVVKADYDTTYVIGGDLDKKVNSGTYERYMSLAMREMAKDWMTYEAKVTGPLEKHVSAAEKEMEKYFKTPKKDETQADFDKRRKTELDKRQAALTGECDTLITNTIKPALTAAGNKAHGVALKTLMSDAKSGLTSNKSIVMKIGGTTIKVGFSITGSVAAAMAIGGVAAGPAGAAIGGTAAVVVAAAVVSVKLLVTVVGMLKSAKSIGAEFNGNYKVYKSSLAALRSQIDETQKKSRALTAKWDAVCVRQAVLQASLEKLTGPMSTIAADKRATKVAELQAKLEAEGRSMAKFIAYDPAKVEEAFQKIKMLLENECSANDFEKHITRLEEYAGRLEVMAGAAETVVTVMSKD